jgi:hypothetical protein
MKGINGSTNTGWYRPSKEERNCTDHTLLRYQVRTTMRRHIYESIFDDTIPRIRLAKILRR